MSSISHDIEQLGEHMLNTALCVMLNPLRKSQGNPKDKHISEEGMRIGRRRCAPFSDRFGDMLPTEPPQTHFCMICYRLKKRNMMSCTLSTSDVLIVGAGPTGLTLAHELLRHGIKPRLIEKTPSASPNSKALGVMARTLELLAASGIAREMLELGVKVPMVSIWSSGRHLARLDFAHGIDSPYPFILMIPQHTTEAILTRHVLSLGAQGMNTGM